MEKNTSILLLNLLVCQAYGASTPPDLSEKRSLGRLFENHRKITKGQINPNDNDTLKTIDTARKSGHTPDGQRILGTLDTEIASEDAELRRIIEKSDDLTSVQKIYALFLLAKEKKAFEERGKSINIESIIRQALAKK